MLRSVVEHLPEADRAWLDQQLIARAFAGYQDLAEQLSARGYRISKSALHRYGQRFEERVAALKLATEQARAVVEAAPDDEGAMNEALMRLVQEKMFAALLDMEVDPATLRLDRLGARIAELGRASVVQKKWADELRTRAAGAAQRAEAIARKGGLTQDAVDSIRREILGIAA